MFNAMLSAHITDFTFAGFPAIVRSYVLHLDIRTKDRQKLSESSFFIGLKGPS